MLGKTVRMGGACKNSVRLSMNDGPIETDEHMRENISCILDWIVGLVEMHFLGIICSFS